MSILTSTTIKCVGRHCSLQYDHKSIVYQVAAICLISKPVYSLYTIWIKIQYAFSKSQLITIVCHKLLKFKQTEVVCAQKYVFDIEQLWVMLQGSNHNYIQFVIMQWFQLWTSKYTWYRWCTCIAVSQLWLEKNCIDVV